MGSRKRGTKVPFLEMILLSTAAVILVGIVGATVWAFASGRARPGNRTASRSSAAVSPAADRLPSDLPPEGMFSDLGSLRAFTADEDPAVVAVTPVFAYNPADIAFREELTAKKTILRSGITAWFRGKTRTELLKLGDSGVKAEILDEINGMLETGTVSRLFFTEYLVLD